MKIKEIKRELVRVEMIHAKRISDLALIKHDKSRDFKKEGIGMLAHYFKTSESSFEIVSKTNTEAFVKFSFETEPSFHIEFVSLYEIIS